MTRKDFIIIADAIKECSTRRVKRVRGGRYPALNRNELLDKLCRALGRDNPAFMPSRFVRYINGQCGPAGGKVRKNH